MKSVRNKEEVEYVVNKLADDRDHKTCVNESDYEQGALDMYDWLVGNSDTPPDR